MELEWEWNGSRMARALSLCRTTQIISWLFRFPKIDLKIDLKFALKLSVKIFLEA